MPTIKEKQDINEALLQDVLAVYSDAENKVLNSVAKRVAKGIKTEGWNEQKLKDTQGLKKEIEAILSNTSKTSKAKVSKGIIEAYKNGVENVKTKKGMHNTVLDKLEIPMNLKMQILATNNLLDNATFQVLRKASDAYQKVMSQATTGLLSGVDTRIQASQKMLNAFASKGITTFVDKSGRNWDLGSYAEMCARTVGAHAALQGHVDRQIEVGEDLVKVSTIGTTCPICSRWQGVVLSISGKSPGYHSMDSAKASGLFHPNCKHTFGMFIPELDGEGKKEPNEPASNPTSDERYKMIEKQRANERQIRYWKKRKALAITPESEQQCNNKIKAWQLKNLIHCEKTGLRRQYPREAVLYGKPNESGGTFIGGSLKEYEDAFKSIVGSDAKKTFKGLKMNLQLFADKKYEKWLKDEIASLDDLDVDKAMLKDASNKAVTPTSLYKKYIGEKPMEDFSKVTAYEKGTKEYKSGYAKWLKTQIDEIGVSYKVKPKYTEVHEEIPIEDTKLSATEIFKKYNSGKAPTAAYKELGGEEATGMKYAKWVETQKKELIKNGITKTVPFDNNVVQKTTETITNATKTIESAKDILFKQQVDEFKNTLDAEATSAYKASQFVKTASSHIESAKALGNSGDVKLAKAQYELAKEKDLEMNKIKAQKAPSIAALDDEIDNLNFSITTLENKGLKDAAKHVKNKLEIFKEQKKQVMAAQKGTGGAVNKASDDPHIKFNKVPTWKLTKALGEMEGSSENMFGMMFEEQKQFYVEHLNKKDFSTYSEEELKQTIQMLDEADKGILGLTKEEIKKKEKADALLKGKAEGVSRVTLGRETPFNKGELVERSKIYQKLDRSDLEKLSDQVAGHKLFTASRRDILGRNAQGVNHHMGHKVNLKSGLSETEKQIGEAFAFAYDEYFNTIKCQPINLAYLQGYEKASSTMKKKIDLMNRAIQSVELNEPILLHRYVDKDIIKALFKTDDVFSIDKGDLFDNNTFMSTATGGHPTFGKRKYKLTLQVDKGTHALPTINHEELEVLLGKGKLEFVKANKYTSSNPQKLQNYDGTWTEFVGDEAVVRYIEDKKAFEYEKVTANKIKEMLDSQTNVAYHTKESSGWTSSLSSAEMTAQKKYTGPWYGQMNDVYRRGKRDEENIVKWSEDLTKALKRVETNQPVVLRRGVYESDLAHMLGFNGDFSKVKANWDEVNKGGYAAEDKGFLSTSPIKTGGFSKDVELRIYCPTGTHAAYVQAISSHPSEKETLLQSGSMYKVHKLEKKGSVTVAYIELLGTD